MVSLMVLISGRGPQNRRDVSENLPFRIGTPLDLWNKVMKEVAECRYAGPYTLENLPFDRYVQLPLGLVPKAGNKQRLIFHLSYDFGDLPHHKSVNFFTPQELCSVKYNDLDYAVRCCLHLLRSNNNATLYFGKTDFSHAFRILPILLKHRKWLVMMAKHPVSKKRFYFIDLCLPFGSSRSCALFQEFSNAMSHIAAHRFTGFIVLPIAIANYLDNFLFIALCAKTCNGMVEEFVIICQMVGCPISEEKTEKASMMIIFLGVLLDGFNKLMIVPEDKRLKARNLLNWAINMKKVTIKFVQQLTGTLNFLNKAIVPGRAFTRGMYTKLKLTDAKGNTLKQHHHVWLNRSFLQDCRMWLKFLSGTKLELCKPFVDLSLNTFAADNLQIYSDASRSEVLGMGAVFLEIDAWIQMNWDSDFILSQKPSIEFLELYALVASLLTWGDTQYLSNCRVSVYCDNQVVVHMVNNFASSCEQCMKLLRILTLDCIRRNRRVFVLYVRTNLNKLADALSTRKFVKFWEIAP